MQKMNEKIYLVTEFGAIPDGETLCTKAVQKTVDICHENGGGIVRFGGGRYALSTIFLKSNVHIQVDKDAEILGSLNFYDFAQQEEIDYPIYQDASHTYFDLPYLWEEIAKIFPLQAKGRLICAPFGMKTACAAKP